MIVVFDLDGTVALIDHRRHLVSGPSAGHNWPAFYDDCDLDEPNVPVIETLRSLHECGHDVSIWSARSDIVSLKTLLWLRKNRVPSDVNLRMRKRDDFRRDEVLKEEWLTEAIQKGQKPDLVFDDRRKVVEMWRRHGIVCAQVAEGEF